jgi:hypothetical protein
MLKALSFLIGAVMGLVVIGTLAPFATLLGIPSGPGWWVAIAPFMLFMGWLCARED